MPVSEQLAPSSLLPSCHRKTLDIAKISLTYSISEACMSSFLEDDYSPMKVGRTSLLSGLSKHGTTEAFPYRDVSGTPSHESIKTM